MGGFDAEWGPVSFVALDCGSAEGNVLSRIAYGCQLDEDSEMSAADVSIPDDESGRDGRVIHVAHMGDFDGTVESLVPPFLRLSPVPEFAVGDLTECWKGMRGPHAVVAQLAIPPVTEEPSTVVIAYGVTQSEVRQVVLWCEEFGGHVGFSQGPLVLVDAKYVCYIHHDAATRAMFQQSIGVDWGQRIPDTSDAHLFFGSNCPVEVKKPVRNDAVTHLPNVVALKVWNCPEEVHRNAIQLLTDHKRVVYKNVAIQPA